MTRTQPGLAWDFYHTLGSWTAPITEHGHDGTRYLVQADHIMDWVLHRRIKDRYRASLIVYRKPAIDLGYYDSAEEAKQACEQHWQANSG